MPYRTQSADTTRELEELLFEGYRRMSATEKMERVGRLGRMVKSVVLAGLRAQYPDADAHELALRVAARLLDRATMLSAYGWAPDDVEEQARC